VESLFDFNQIIWKENEKYEKVNSKSSKTPQKRSSITLNQTVILDVPETKSVSEEDDPQTPSNGNRSRSTSEMSDQLENKSRGRSMSVSSQQSDPVLHYIPEIQKTYKSSYLKPESKRDTRLRELDNSIFKANKILAMHKVSTVNFIDENVSYSIEHKPGVYVKCLGFVGIVVKFREHEGVYEVNLLDNITQANVTAKAYVLANILEPYIIPKDKSLSSKSQPKTPMTSSASTAVSVTITETTTTNVSSVEATVVTYNESIDTQVVNTDQMSLPATDILSSADTTSSSE
jgi:hypothetical protein